MSEQTKNMDENQRPEGVEAGERARDNEENELEAEQESAAAMDADVPQPPDSSSTTEGQPS
ncbi:MAG TPA: hypothetical protein VD861_02400 [Pyrinomonadaceae bacterium]|nr:hypothetical protein [Pyrinomonadaceae bacterium]